MDTNKKRKLPKVKVRLNVWGGWYGFLGTRRVADLGGYNSGRYDAALWLQWAESRLAHGLPVLDPSGRWTLDDWKDLPPC